MAVLKRLKFAARSEAFNAQHKSLLIVSLFEPDTEVIRKGKAGQPTELGKMVKIQEAEQQIVTHYEMGTIRKPPHDDP